LAIRSYYKIQPSSKISKGELKGDKNNNNKFKDVKYQMDENQLMSLFVMKILKYFILEIS
jgi:hypothetical protein